MKTWAALAIALLWPMPARAECTVTGRLTDPRVRVTSVEGHAPRYVAIEDTDAVVTPVRHGLVRIQSRLPDGRAFEGESRRAPAYEIAAHLALPGVELGAGVQVLDLAPIADSDDAEVDLLLAPGVTLHEVRIGCAAIALAGATRRPGDLAVPPVVASPRLRPRGRDLRVTSGDTVLRLRFEAPDEVVVFERTRRIDVLEVTLPFADAQVSGSVGAATLIPITESLETRHRWYRRSRRRP